MAAGPTGVYAGKRLNYNYGDRKESNRIGHDDLSGQYRKGVFMVGGLFILLGIIFSAGEKIPWLGRLPGDILVEKENFSFYFPLVTCLIISLLVPLVFFVLRRFF